MKNLIKTTYFTSTLMLSAEGPTCSVSLHRTCRL